MERVRFGKAWRLDFVTYAAAVLIAIAVGGHLLGIWSHGLSIPNSYKGDTLLTSAVMKGIAETGSPYTNPHLSAPGEGEMFDFPGADGMFSLEIWVISRFVSDYAVILNLFAWLSYPLIALASAWAMRRLRFSRPSAFVFALLYTCIPFHQSRVTGHQYLSAYFVVPLAIALITLFVFTVEAPGKTKVAEETPKLKQPWKLPPWAWLIAIAIGICGVYYAYFAIVLTLVAGVVTSYARRDIRRMIPALLIVAVVGAIVVAQFLPSYVYWHRHGSNNTAQARQPLESDLYGLRLTQLVFPASGHRLAAFDASKNYLRASLAVISSNFLNIAYDSSLGVVGVVGFFILLFWAVTAGLRAPPLLRGEPVPAKLAVLGISSFLLATVGGVGSLIAFLGFPQIRCYDRITPYIAFFSLCAAAWLADICAQRIWGDPARRGRLFRGSIVGLCFFGTLMFGLWDQTNPSTKPDYSTIAVEYQSDAQFVEGVESALPEGAMVFQLPYVAFPESAAVVNTSGYDPLRMYLHSKSLRWSAGAFRGREDARWQERVVAESTPAMLSELKRAGFSGLVVDRFGYEDKGAALEAEIESTLGETASLESPDKRFVFFSLQD